MSRRTEPHKGTTSYRAIEQPTPTQLLGWANATGVLARIDPMAASGKAPISNKTHFLISGIYQAALASWKKKLAQNPALASQMPQIRAVRGSEAVVRLRQAPVHGSSLQVAQNLGSFFNQLGRRKQLGAGQRF